MSVIDNDDLITNIVSQKKEPTAEELEEFKTFVNDWFKFDDQIRKLEIAIKERKNYKKVLNNKIQEFMFQFNYNDLNTEQGRIKSNIREVKVPIKITDIKDKILKYKDLSGEDLINQIFNEDRETVVKKNIRRIIPRVSLTI